MYKVNGMCKEVWMGYKRDYSFGEIDENHECKSDSLQ
jgi:hypothetical protein